MRTNSSRKDFFTNKNSMEALLDAFDSGITVQDRNFNIIYQNEVIQKIFGDRIDEKCYRVYEGNEGICESCPVFKSFEDGKSHTTERKTVLSSGETAYWENTSNPIKDEKGEIIACLEVVRNITHRKRKEEDLNLKALLLDSINDSVFVHDFDGNFVYVNRAAYENRSYTKEELLNMNLRDLDVPDYAHIINQRIRELTEKGSIIFESAHYKKDGTIMPLEIHSRLINSEKGELILSVARDITERKRREKELKIKDMAIESSFNGIALADHDGKLFYVNPASLQMWGYDEQEVLGRHFTDFWESDGFEGLKEYLNNQGGWIGELNGKRKDGSTFPAQVAISVVKDEKQSPCCYVGSFFDITDRKNAERRSKIMEDAVGSSINATVLSDLEGYVNYVNKSFLKMWGYDEQEVLGKHVADFWESKEKALDVKRELEESGGWVGELTARRKDGSTFTTQLSASLVKEENEKPICLMASFIDITEKKRMEESQRQLNEILKLLNKTLRHDILNDLTVVSNSVEVYSETESKNILDRIFESIQKSTNLIKEMRELEDLVSSGGNLASYDIREVTENVMEKQDVEYTVTGNCTVTADNALYSVIDNLVRNSIKHGNADRIDFVMENKGEFCDFKVIDNGNGIPEDLQEQIFEEGVSGANGTGLGLYIARKTMERYGGSIGIEETSDRGTTFVLKLRLPESEDSGEEVEEQTSNP
ncbi:MAG: PAS domain-containing sensor histidine kinase [Kosmotogaceae bacterium]